MWAILTDLKISFSEYRKVKVSGTEKEVKGYEDCKGLHDSTLNFTLFQDFTL